jgi:TolB protein
MLVDGATKILEKENIEYAYPHWSKDGKRILFQSNETGLWQIYIMDEDGGNIQQITTDSSNNNFIDWSPDNQKISFVSDRTGNEEVYLINTSGEDLQQLTFNDERDIHPYWSPDGKKIYFNTSRDDISDFEIYEMDSDGQNKRRITSTDDNETCARLSPEGNDLVFLRNNAEGLNGIFIRNLTDSTEYQITSTESRNGWPSWFPDGKKIILSSKENDVYKLYVYDLADNEMKKISNPPAPYWDARANVSRDGKKIVFNRQISAEKNTIGIYILNL